MNIIYHEGVEVAYPCQKQEKCVYCPHHLRILKHAQAYISAEETTLRESSRLSRTYEDEKGCSGTLTSPREGTKADCGEKGSLNSQKAHLYKKTPAFGGFFLTSFHRWYQYT